ncbi:hypothetical protein EST38_g8996 [Candolleomyces aberdarensis]|uniref:F-box domain-containing protein n=1 Tax=Candolleomyces aberdarensis TaxID=2316362 RepID=A0A4Q2DDZ1_9AGAR|nr:hypothetical protein EST38_g8996 [Candolleomyces aberdarensis]
MNHPGALQTSNVINGLLKNNEPPSDEERVGILSMLQDLKAQLERPQGNANKVQSLQANNTYRSILSVLSFVRCIPIEVWQRVFEFVVFDPTMKDCDPLRMLSSVSRRWEAAASTHQILWSILPPVSLLDTASPIVPSQHNAVLSRLQLFLSRSGSNHIDFQCFYSSSEDVWGMNRTVILDILNIFVEVSHRWKEAVLHIPAEIVEEALAPLRAHDRLPHLEKLQLELSVWAFDKERLRQPSRVVRVDYFHNAPNLRHVTVNTSVISVPVFPIHVLEDNNTIFDFHLPWSQIEIYKSRIATDGRDGNCCQLIPDTDTGREPRERLREVVYHVRNGNLPVPNRVSPIILPSLVKLALRMGNTYPGDILIRHLSRLDEKVGPRSADQLRELLFLCPNLEHLDVRALQDQELQVLRRNATPPGLLPNLKVLTLRWPAEYTYHESYMPAIRGWKPPIVKPSTLWDVVQSRLSTPAQQRPQLQEVRLLGSSPSSEEYEVLNAQMNLLIGDNALPFPAGSWAASSTLDYEGLSQLRSALQKKFKPIGGKYQTGAHVNLMLHWEMDGIMGKLEELDLEGCKGVILARMGVLYHLDEIARTEEEVIPGDWIYSFRSRAANLLAKWKPIILPQFQGLPYRWCYVPLGSARLQCQPIPDRNSGYFWLKDFLLRLISSPFLPMQPKTLRGGMQLDILSIKHTKKFLYAPNAGYRDITMDNFEFSSNTVELYLVNIGPPNATNSRATIWALALVDEVDRTNGVLVSVVPRPSPSVRDAMEPVLEDPQKFSLPSLAKSGESPWRAAGKFTTSSSGSGTTDYTNLNYPLGWVLLSYCYIGRDPHLGPAVSQDIIGKCIGKAVSANAYWKLTDKYPTTGCSEYVEWLGEVTQDWAIRACRNVEECLKMATAKKDLTRDGMAKEMDAAMAKN